uniref:Pentacotripeptide-repeat region of PRORP domain-containing protein n=1 Tax=Pinguiococcus pyrenoidosus TaxID=172671 RepID=A0A7R9YEJ5_9STRA
MDHEMAELLDKVEAAGMADASHYFWLQMRAFTLPKERRRDSTEKLLRRLLARDVRPNTSNYEIVFKALQSCPRDVAKMHELLAELQTREIPISRDIYHCCLDLLSQRNRFLDVPRVEALARSMALVDGGADGGGLHFLIRAYVYGGFPERVKAVLDEMDFAGVSLDGAAYLDMPQLIRLLSGEGEDGAALAADLLRRFREAAPARTEIYNDVLKTLARFEHFTKEDVERLLADMAGAGVEASPKTYSCVLEKYANSKPPDAAGAREVIRRMKAAGMRPSIKHYSIVMNAFCRLGMPEEAHQLLDAMDEDGVLPNAVSFVAIINACAKAKEPRAHFALAVVEDMKRRGVQPTTKILNVLINAFAESDVKRTDVLLKYMREWKVPLDVVTYNTLMKLLMRASAPNLSGALVVFEDMRRRGEVSWTSYAYALSAYNRMGRVEQAEALLDEMVTSGMKPRGDDFFMVMQGFSRTRRPKDCERVLWKAVGAVAPPQPKWFWKASSAYVSDGKVGDALRVLDQMRQADLDPGIAAYNIILNGFASDELGEAVKLFKHIERSEVEPDIVTFNTMLKMMSRMYDVEPSLAKTVLDALDASGLATDHMTYAAAIEVWGKALRSPDVAKAERLLDEYVKISTGGMSSSPFEALLRVYSAEPEERLSDMEQLLARMAELGVAVRQNAYNAFLQGYKRRPEAASPKVLDILREMSSQGLPPDAVSYDLAFRVFADDTSSDLDEVKQVYDAIRGTKLVGPHVYQNYWRLVSARSDVDAMEACIADMQLQGVRVSTSVVASLIHAYGMARPPDLNAAEEAYARFVDAGGAPDAKIYNGRLKAAALAGEFHHAVEVFTEMHQRGLRPDHETYGALTHAACMSGAFDEGRQWLAEGIRRGFVPSSMRAAVPYERQSLVELPQVEKDA